MVSARTDVALVQYLTQYRGGVVRQSLCHRQKQQGGKRLCQHAWLVNGAPGMQCGTQVEAAQETFAVGMARYTPQCGMQAGELRQPFVTHGAVWCTQPHATQSARVDTERSRGPQGIVPCQVHAPSTSSSARCTRMPEPVSSRGLRRKRWRKAKGAMCLRCSVVTDFFPCRAA